MGFAPITDANEGREGVKTVREVWWIALAVVLMSIGYETRNDLPASGIALILVAGAIFGRITK